MAVAQRQASPTPSPQHLQCDSQALIALAVQITMAVAHKHTLPTSENPCCGNHNGSSAQRHVANIRAAAITMRFRTSEKPCCANHDGSSAQSQWQPLLEALDIAPATRKAASGTSGDNARHSFFWRLWILRLPRGRQPAAPAATTRATAPSGGSGYCACHEDSQRHQRRQPAPQPLLEALGTAPATRKTASGTSGDNAPQPLLEALGTAPATRTASGTSGDNACRSPFWRLWVLRLPRGELAAPAATTRAAAPSGGSGFCACHEDSQRHQRRQRAPQPLLEALGTAPATRKTASGTSGDNARRSPFWRLWVPRLPRGQPAAPAATTRAAAPSGGSGYWACHEDSRPFWRLWVLRLPRGRQQAAPAATTALGTAPATRTASGTTGDNARRSPSGSLWVLRLPRGRQQAAPAATTRAAAPSVRLWVLRLPRGRQQAAPAATTHAAAPSGGSHHCACHEDSKRHQQRQRAPQPLLEALGTAPATRKTASGTSGDKPLL